MPHTVELTAENGDVTRRTWEELDDAIFQSLMDHGGCAGVNPLGVLVGALIAYHEWHGDKPECMNEQLPSFEKIMEGCYEMSAAWKRRTGGDA